MDTARLAISSYNAPQPGADQYHSICPWMSLDLQTLYGTSGWNTFWTFNGQPVNATQEVRDSGSYVLSVTDSNGCEAQAIVYLALMDCRCDAAIDFEGRCVEELVHLRAVADSLILNVTWSFDDPIISQAIGQEVEVKLSSVDSITITMDAELSCGHQTQTRRIKLEECAPACEVFVPSAFSPNSDDLNEVFSVYSECRPIAYHLEIHNRLGELVFQSDEMTAKWDGQTMSGEPAEDIYVYRLEYRMPYQNQTVRVGKVALVR